MFFLLPDGYLPVINPGALVLHVSWLEFPMVIFKAGT